MQIDLTAKAPEVAQQLIGCELIVNDEAGLRGGIIIETEAYTLDDPASHSFKGPSLRNQAMFMPAGTIYIYRIYGIHYCLNIVCGKADGQAVLIRALRPTKGITYMKQRRQLNNEAQICNGPAKLVQALGINPALDKTHLTGSIIALTPRVETAIIQASPRIGITRGMATLWRFYIT
jgi:DNA-3-methyladenine glycosylase